MAQPLEFIIEGDDRTRQAFRQLDGSLKRSAKNSKNFLGTLRDITVVATGMVRGLQSIGRAMGGTFEAAKAQVNVEIKLASAFARTGQEVDKSLAKVKAFARSRQDLTTFSDRATLEVAKIGAEFGLTADEIIKATSAIQDRSLVVDRGPVELMRLFGKVMAGISNDFVELGVRVDKTASRSEKFNAAIEQMSSGVAELIGKMPTSAFQMLTNRIEDAKEGLGKLIVSTRTFQTVVAFLDRKLKAISDALSDTTEMKKWVAAFDRFVTTVVRGSALAAAAVIEWGVAILDTLEAIARLIMEVGGAMGHIDNASGKIDNMAGSVHRSTALLRMSAKAIRDWAESFELVDAKSVEDVMNQITELLEGGKVTPPTEAISPVAEAMGAEYGSIFVAAMQGSFDREVGVEEAFRNLGDRARDAFVGQMSEAAFKPIEGVIGKVAEALARPFEIVGESVGKILDNILDIVFELFRRLGVQIGILEATSVKSGAVASAAMVPVLAEASTAAGIWAKAAAAASIATFGAAAAFSAPALFAIQAAGAVARVPLAEGGIIKATPGGVPALVGEGGKDELVAPLDKLPGLLRQALGGGNASMGGGTSIVVEMNPDVINFGEDPEADLALLGQEFSDRIIEARDFANFSRGVAVVF